MSFHIGDKVSHPVHGAGVLESIVQKKVDGVTRDYFIMRPPKGTMTIMIPIESSQEIGVRPVLEQEQLDRVLAAIPELKVEMTPNWNRRYRENLERIKSGNLLEVAAVAKGLTQRDTSRRGLSTGERKMLNSARQILISEIVLSKGQSYEAAEAELNSALS